MLIYIYKKHFYVPMNLKRNKKSMVVGAAHPRMA